MSHLILTCTYLYVFSNLRNPMGASQMLDLTPMAYDDQYINCEEKMEKIISTKLLEEEKAKDKDFGGAWDKAALEWDKRKKKKNLPSLPRYFQDNHAIAILVYTDKNYLSRGKSLPSRFNEAVRLSVTSQGRYMRDFHFKSLHFYLTTGLRLFKTSCRDVHRGIKGVNFVPPSGSDKGIRFGQFTSSSVSPAAAGRFGQDSYLKIRTCYGVNIEEFSYDPSEKEVLIPTNEVFNVTDFKKEGHRFVLVSTTKRCYYHNCAYIRWERSHTCIYSSASSIAAISSTRPVRLFQEFVIRAAVLGLFVNL